MNRVVLCLCSMALASVIAGCHAVTPIKADGYGIDDQGYCVESDSDDLCNAINLADGYRRGYLRRAGIVSGTRDALGYSIIAASTLALYYGASPQPTRTTAAGAVVSSPDYAQRVRRLGAFAAGTYAYGQWGSPKARDLVYIDGARAMTCAVLKASPALPAINQQENLQNLLDDVRDRTEELIKASESPALTSEDVASVSLLLDESANLDGEASQLLADIQVAGSALRARIQLIDVAVRKRLVDSSPTFESLVALTASLPGISRSLNASLALPAPGDSKISATPSDGAVDADNESLDRRAKEREDAKAALEAAAEALTKAARRLKAALIPLAGIRSAIDSVEECSVGGGAQFSIAPSATSATLEAGKTYQVVITDPVGHPRASITGGQAEAVVLGPMELTGKDHEYRVVVTGEKPTTPATKPILSIRSASGLSGADINLTVTGDAVATKDEEEDPGKKKKQRTDVCDSADDCSFDTAFVSVPADVMALQCLVGAPADCIMGPTTRSKLAAYRAKMGYPPGNFVDAKVKTDLGGYQIEIAADPTRYRCPKPEEKPVTCPDP